MKKNVLIPLAVLISATTMLTGCFSSEETPTESTVSESQVESSSLTTPESESVFSEEESAYRTWKDLETNEPAFDKNGAGVDVQELLNRAVTVENFLQDYPESVYKDEAVEYYNKLVTAAITGGYVSETPDSHLYLDESGKAIRKEVLDTYNTFLEGNAGTKTANIVEEYVTLLGNESGNFTDSVKNFYVDIVERMKNMFDMNATDNSETPSSKANSKSAR